MLVSYTHREQAWPDLFPGEGPVPPNEKSPEEGPVTPKEKLPEEGPVTPKEKLPGSVELFLPAWGRRRQEEKAAPSLATERLTSCACQEP